MQNIAIITEAQTYRKYVTAGFCYTRGILLRLLGSLEDGSDLSCALQSHSSLMGPKCQDVLFGQGNFQMMFHCRSHSVRC